jgi:hypothetical protein
MHERGIIGYFAGKNGVGIRVFLNRASSSIGTRAAGQKILEFRRASSGDAHTSSDEVAFRDSFAELEISETDLNPRAPQNGAEKTAVVKTAPVPFQSSLGHSWRGKDSDGRTPSQVPLRVEVPVEEIVSLLRRELEPSLQSAARRAAAQEHERTRDWLESRGLPKAARVAQREAFNVLRKYGIMADAARTSHAEVGRGGYVPPEPHTLTNEEVAELAQACVAMLEAQGQAIEVTLSEMSAAAGGFLLPEDAPRVRRKIQTLVGGPSSRHEGAPDD